MSKYKKALQEIQKLCLDELPEGWKRIDNTLQTELNLEKSRRKAMLDVCKVALAKKEKSKQTEMAT